MAKRAAATRKRVVLAAGATLIGTAALVVYYSGRSGNLVSRIRRSPPSFDKNDSLALEGATTKFQGSLWMTHLVTLQEEGGRHDSQDDRAWSWMGDLLVDTYNQLAAGGQSHNNNQNNNNDTASSSSSSSVVCDMYDRRLVSATPADIVRYTPEELQALREEVSHQHSSPQDSETVSERTMAWRVRYDVQGSCHGCAPDGSDILSTTTTREGPLQQSQRGLRHHLEQGATSLSGSSNKCQNPEATRGVLEERTVRQALNSAIQSQQPSSTTRKVIVQHIKTTSRKIEGKERKELPVPSSRLIERQLQDEEETERYDCTAPVQQVNTTVYIRISDNLRKNLGISSRAINIIQNSFAEVYNDMTYTLCDVPHFRRVTSVSAQVFPEDPSLLARDAVDRLWEDSTLSETTPVPTNVLALQIQAECLDCNASTPLFHSLAWPEVFQDNPIPASTTTSNIPTTGSIIIERYGGDVSSRQGSSDVSCVCPKNDTNVFRAPTTSEFRQAWDEYLQTVDEGGLAYRVFQVEEEQRFDCLDLAVGEEDNNDVVFISYAYMDLDALFQPLLSEDDKVLVERVFQETYNELSYLHCDSYFRQVSNVTMIVTGSDPNATRSAALNAINSATQLAVVTNTDISRGTTLQLGDLAANITSSQVVTTQGVFFLVETTCRGCLNGITTEMNLTLFDHTTTNSTQGGRRLAQTAVSSWQRVLEASGDKVCICPPGAQPGLRGAPTEMEFVQAFNEKLQEQMLTATLDYVPSAEQVVESSEVPCTSNETKIFSSAVVADFSVHVTYNWSEADEKFLEDAFRDVYNSIAFTRCDNQFRNILNVSVEVDLEYNSSVLATSNVSYIFTNETDVQVEVQFFVTAECRGCNVSEIGVSNLFDVNVPLDLLLTESLSGRRLTSPTEAAGRSLLAVGSVPNETCFCPAGTEPGANQGPRLGEFETFLNDRIGDLKVQGVLSSSYEVNSGNYTAKDDSLNNMAEAHPVPCSTNLTMFQSAVYTGLYVDERYLDTAEILKIEQGFRLLYNDLTFRGCDAYFRTIDEVELVIGNIEVKERRLQDASNATIDNSTSALNATISGNGTNATLLEPTMFLVTGECRNCPTTQSGSFNLFDDAFRRRLIELVDSRALQADIDLFELGTEAMVDRESDVCYCPSGVEPGEGQPPDAAQFATIFDQIVISATNDEAIQIAGADQRIVEVDVSCARLELEIVEGVYKFDIPRDILRLERSELARFINYAFPKAYNEFRVGECSPAVLQAEVLVPGTTQNPESVVKLLTIQPKSEHVTLFRNEQHEQDVAERLREIFYSMQTSRVPPLEIPTDPPTDPPAEASPSAPQPTNPAPQPTNQQPQPTNPEPTNPRPTNPQPTNPRPTNPQPTNPRPTNPPPTNRPPTNRPPTNPQPTNSNPQPTNPQATPSPTRRPTSSPTRKPTTSPTRKPTVAPTGAPTPTKSPTKSPSLSPSDSPSVAPSNSPSGTPSEPPTESPTPAPTGKPSATPTLTPTKTPTASPSKSPTLPPTDLPTPEPTPSPTEPPTPQPTDSPTPIPTTLAPTREPFAIERFALIDCSNSFPVPGFENLPDYVEFDRANLPLEMTIEAVTDPAEISEVRFFLDGQLKETEKKPPYSLSSNRGDGSFRPSDIFDDQWLNRVRTLEAEPVWWWGIPETRKVIQFKVIDTSATSRSANPDLGGPF